MTAAKRWARLAALALVVVCSTLLFWMAAWRGEASSAWEYPELAPPARLPEPPVAPTASEDAIPIELRIDPVSALDAPTVPRGELTLRVVSRVGERPVPATLRWLAGAVAPRVDRVDGAATLAGLAAGSGWLEIEGPGRRLTSRLVRLPRGEPIDLDWNRTASVAGSVFDGDGLPLAGAEVWIEGQSARTASDGRFSVASVLAGDDVPVRVTAPGRASYQEIVRVATAAPPLRFVLRPGRRLAGTVHVPAAARGAARVFALPVAAAGGHAFPWFWPGRYCDVRLDADGQFALDGLPRDAAIAIGLLHPLVVMDEPIRLLASGESRSAAARVGVVPRAVPVATGQVGETARQRGLPEAQVRTSPVGQPAWGEAFAWGGVALAPDVRALGGCAATCDGEGRFAVGLPWRRTEVHAVAAGHVGQRRVVAAAVPPELDFELDALGSEASSGPVAVVVRIRTEPLAVLPRLWLVQVRWAGQPRGPAFRHDARQPLVVPLGRAAIVDLTLRRPGSTTAAVRKGLRVAGRIELELVVPGP